MLKKTALILLVLIPAVLRAQVSFEGVSASVSGVTGTGGFVAARGSLSYQATDDLTLIPNYSYYTLTDDSPSVSRFGLRAEYQPGKIAWGLEGGYVPRTGGYMNYSAAGDAKYYFIGPRRGPMEMLYAGPGVQYVRHEQDAGFSDGFGGITPAYVLDETRVNLLGGVTIKPVVISSVLSKGFYNQTPPPVGNIWTDVPYFVTVNRSFLDYYWVNYATLPLDLFDLHGTYAVAKNYWADNPYQSAGFGVTVKVMGVSVTGDIEFRDLGSGNNRTYYSLSAKLL